MTPPGMSPGEILLAAFGFWLLIFLIARGIVLWYWKINRMVHLLESIDASLKQLPAVARSLPAARVGRP